MLHFAQCDSLRSSSRIGTALESSMTQVVVCEKCGATFRNRTFWALPSSVDIPRKDCPRCATKGPFREATRADIVAFSEQLNKNFSILGIIELVGIVLVVIFVILGLFK